MTVEPHPQEALLRLRTSARAVLVLGIAASLAANVLAAEPTAVGRVVAAWSPVALLLTVELISRVPVTGGWLSTTRIAVTASIAGIAGWVSYWHMVEVAVAHGEATVAAHLLPISVDGLVVVASICIGELSNRPQSSDPETAEPLAQRAKSSAPGRLSTRRNGSEAARQTPANGSRRGSIREQVRQVASQHPSWSQARIAREVGCTDRTVRRHLSPSAKDTSTGEKESV